MRLLGGQIPISHSLVWSAQKDFVALFVLPVASHPKNERIYPSLKQKSSPCPQKQHLAPSLALFHQKPQISHWNSEPARPRRVSWQGSEVLIRIIIELFGFLWSILSPPGLSARGNAPAGFWLQKNTKCEQRNRPRLGWDVEEPREGTAAANSHQNQVEILI